MDYSSAEESYSEDSDSSGGPLRRPSSQTVRGGFSARTIGGGSRNKKRSETHVPARLPWRVLNLFLRALQLAWFFMGVMYSLEAVDVLEFDYLSYVGGEERRLGASSDADFSWEFEDLPVSHPHHDLFCPLHVSCLSGIRGSPRFLVRTRHEQYVASAREPTWADRTDELLENISGLELNALLEHQIPPDAVVLCMPNAQVSFREVADLRPLIQERRCMLAALQMNGTALALWGMDAPREEASILRVVGQSPWRSFAGALVPCSEVAELLEILDQSGGQDSWCILLAGWDGTRIPVAALRLRGNIDVPGLPSEVLPAFDLPGPRHQDSRSAATATAGRLLDAAARPAEGMLGESGMVALHVDAPQARVWALSSEGDLELWDMASPKSLGVWQPQWPLTSLRDFQVAGLCGGHNTGELHVLAQGQSAGLRWFRATTLPSQMS